MAGETQITIVGRLTADVELRFTPSGAAVASLNVAVNARQFDKQANEWKDKPATFWRVNAWNQGKLTLAENIANVLKRGDTVIVTGEVETREWDKGGETRRSTEIRAQSIGKDLRFHADATSQTAPGAWDPHAQSAPATGGWDAPATSGWPSGEQARDNLTNGLGASAIEPPF